VGRTIPLVSETFTLLHNYRPFLNGNPVRELPTTLMGAIAFPALLLVAQVRVEGSATALVLEDMLVDPLMANSWEVLLFEPKADLFRAPILV